MKAYVLHEIGKLVYEDYEIPQCKPGWAIVKVKAAGICSSDIPRIFTKGTYHFPTIPGHEFSGIVSSVGDSKDEQWIGKRVGVFPLIPCFKCEQCHNKHYEMCANYDYIGSRRDGAFAEYVAVPIWNLITLPENVPFVFGAMLEPLAVAYHAIKQCNISRDTHVAIVGTGMIGLAAAQWALIQGAESVTVIGRSEEKRGLVEGVPGLSYAAESSLNGVTFDSVLEAVGSSISISQALSIANAGSRVVLMGNPAGAIHLPQEIYWRILRKQLNVVGTWNSSYENEGESDWSVVVNGLKENLIHVDHLITHSFDQTQLELGLKMMRQHEIPYCKVMTTWNGGDD